MKSIYVSGRSYRGLSVSLCVSDSEMKSVRAHDRNKEQKEKQNDNLLFLLDGGVVDDKTTRFGVIVPAVTIN